MKKAFTVLSLILVFAFVLVSCEEGLPDSLTSVMGIMGNNILGVDTSKVDDAVKESAAKGQSTDEPVTVGGQEIVFDRANGSITIGSFGSVPVDSSLVPEVIMLPSDNLSSVIEVLESNAGAAMREELKKPVTGDELKAVEGTATLIEAAFDAALDSIDADDTVGQTLLSIKESMTLPEGESYTKADALFLQALTNVVFSAADIVSDVADSEEEQEPDVSEMIESIYPDLMALNSISQNSGSSLTLDLAGIFDQLTK